MKLDPPSFSNTSIFHRGSPLNNSMQDPEHFNDHSMEDPESRSNSMENLINSCNNSIEDSEHSMQDSELNAEKRMPHLHSQSPIEKEKGNSSVVSDNTIIHSFVDQDIYELPPPMPSLQSLKTMGSHQPTPLRCSTPSS